MSVAKRLVLPLFGYAWFKVWAYYDNLELHNFNRVVNGRSMNGEIIASICHAFYPNKINHEARLKMMLTS